MAISLGDGTTATASGPLTLKLQYGAYAGNITAHVMKLTEQYDVILGNAFLTQTNAVSEYDDQGLKRLVLKRGNRKFTVNRPAFGLRQECSAPLLSAMQAGKAMKRKDNVFLVRVTESMEEAAVCAHAEVAAAKTDDRAGRIPEERLQAIIRKFTSVLVDELPPGLPPDRGVGHVITLEKGARPTYRPSRRLSPLELAEVQAHVKKLLLNGHIEPSKSPFGANVLFVQKKDGTLRMCLDYRALNKVTVQNKYPLPRIDDLIDKMAGAKCFSSLDLASGYHQIRIAEEDVPKTAFSTPFGHYQFKVLAFGLTNAPATFQYAMNNLFASQLGRYVCVYLDDILIFSKNAEEHEKHLEEVLDILEKNKFYAKLSKCDLNRSELLYLGHIVGANGIKVDPAKIAAVAEWPVPKDLTQLRSFLGLTNYFRKFIQGYASRCRPLTSLMRKGMPYAWSPECQAAFEGLKQDLTTAPVLSAPDFSKAFEVVTDSSQWSIGGVLLQEGRPLAYTSRKMIPAELNYTVTEQECLATVHAMKTWRCYLEGLGSDMLTLVTDHNPNVHLQDQQSLSRRQVRWVEFLQRFHFRWSYRPGRLNVADPISRRAYPEQGADPIPVHFGALTRGARRAATGSAVTPAVSPGRQLPVSVDEVTVSAFQEGYKVDAESQGMLTKGGLTAAQGLLWHGDALMVPKHSSLRQDVMFNLHDASISGHPGIRRTKKLIRRYFWWPGMDTDIEAYVQTCATCQRNKARTHSATVPLLPLEAPGKPWQSVSMDFITSLPKTKAGKTAILVFVCRLTKMVHMCATVNECTSADCAFLFLSTVFKLHGAPLELVSDRDTRFTSAVWTEMCQLMQIRRSMSTAYHPQTDGQTERMNRVLEDMLRHYVSPTQQDWDVHLPMVEFAINNAYQESTQTTPFMLNYGLHPHTPASINIQGDGPVHQAQKLSKSGRTSFANCFADEMQRIVTHARKLLLSAQQRQKAYHDRKARAKQFNVGDRVLLSTKNIAFKNPGTAKLLPKYAGPFEVLERIGLAAYRLLLPETMKIHDVFHVCLLEPYRDDGRYQPPPVTLFLDGDVQYEIEAVLAVREKRHNKKEFLVKWLGYGPEHNSWEPEANLTNCSEVLQTFWDAQRSAPAGLAKDKQTG